MLPNTKEETQEILDVLYMLEDQGAEDFQRTGILFLCLAVEGLYRKQIIGFSTLVKTRKYITQWYIPHYGHTFAAPFASVLELEVCDYQTDCRLIWLDFMIYELEDHLDSFNSTEETA